jgi:hypothetical protein
MASIRQMDVQIALTPVSSPFQQTFFSSSVSGFVPVQEGDSLVLFIYNDHPSTSVLSITDSAGNTYEQVSGARITGATSFMLDVWVANNVAAGSNLEITINLSEEYTAYTEVAVFDCAGLSGASVLTGTHYNSSDSEEIQGPSLNAGSATGVFLSAMAQLQQSNVTYCPWNLFSSPDGAPQNMSLSSLVASGSQLAWFNYVGFEIGSAILTEVLFIPSPVSITTASLPNGSQVETYNQTLQASGGTTPYTWAILSGSLPPGLSLNASTGVISGTPTGSGTYNFTVQVTDSNSHTATQALAITVAVLYSGSWDAYRANTQSSPQPTFKGHVPNFRPPRKSLF